ncbi:MAG TPA: hypothetical protein VGY48_15620 [Vicinamibacterales bacterium]|jgi:hypothetical protein|nr:hypothetical protein [Vicinamibacterales bacterium]
MKLNASVTSVLRRNADLNGNPIVWVEAEIALTNEAHGIGAARIGSEPLKLTGFESALPVKLGQKVTIEIEDVT